MSYEATQAAISDDRLTAEILAGLGHELALCVERGDEEMMHSIAKSIMTKTTQRENAEINTTS